MPPTTISEDLMYTFAEGCLRMLEKVNREHPNWRQTFTDNGGVMEGKIPFGIAPGGEGSADEIDTVTFRIALNADITKED